MNTLVDLQDINRDINGLLDKIKSPDGATRLEAWQSAGPMGAAAVGGLGDLAASEDKGTARAATMALHTIAHHAARPGAKSEAKLVSAELLKLAQPGRPRMVRSEALTLVGMVGDSEAVPGLAALLEDNEIREEARMALEHIPGSAAQNALKNAEKKAGEDFKPALRQSLYARSLTPKTVGTRSPK